MIIKEEGGRKNYEFGFKIYILLHIKCVSPSVMSDSVIPWIVASVHGIFQARITGVG